jgi:amino acid transporter
LGRRADLVSSSGRAVIFGAVSSSKLATTAVPLVLVGTTLLGAFGGAMMSVGALFSVSGSDESGILGTARLSYALSVDGLFPSAFAKVHKKCGTPYVALLIQGAIAFVLSAFSGLTSLISFSVLNLSFSFLLVSISFIFLKKDKEKGLHGQSILPWLGIAICLFLLYSTSLQDKIMGSVVILAGVPIYAYFSPKNDLAELKEGFLSAPEVTRRYLERTDRLLGRLVKLIRRAFRA